MTDERIARVADRMHSEAARLRTGPVTRTRLPLGDRGVEVITPRHVNESGVSIEGAFFPTAGGATPDFRLTVLDDSVAGAPPTFDWPSAWNEPFGAVRDDHCQPLRFAFDIHSRSFSTFDASTGEAVVWFRDIARVPYWVAATPFRLHFSWMADTFDGEMVHAAGVCIGDGAALIVGPSGAGKSTLALSAALAGSPLLGDDFLLVAGTRAYPVYRRTKAHDVGLGLQGDAAACLGAVLNSDASGEKRIIDTDPSLMSREGRPVAAVFVPRIGERAQVRRLPASSVARRALGPSMQGLLGGSRSTLSRISRLMRAVPTYEITVGPDIDENVSLLRSAAGASPAGVRA